MRSHWFVLHCHFLFNWQFKWEKAAKCSFKALCQIRSHECQNQAQASGSCRFNLFSVVGWGNSSIKKKMRMYIYIQNGIFETVLNCSLLQTNKKCFLIFCWKLIRCGFKQSTIVGTALLTAFQAVFLKLDWQGFVFYKRWKFPLRILRELTIDGTKQSSPPPHPARTHTQLAVKGKRELGVETWREAIT